MSTAWIAEPGRFFAAAGVEVWRIQALARHSTSTILKYVEDAHVKSMGNIASEAALERGCVNKRVPRAELESETLAMAERIARQDLLSLRMTKFSINQAQDAMGFRTSAHAAHSNFMVLASGGVIRKDGEGERRLKGGGRARAEERPRER